MSAVRTLAIVLLVIGGLNWGLIGLFDFDLVARIFGYGSTLSRIIYSVVGLAALYSIGAFLQSDLAEPRLNR